MKFRSLNEARTIQIVEGRETPSVVTRFTDDEKQNWFDIFFFVHSCTSLSYATSLKAQYDDDDTEKETDRCADINIHPGTHHFPFSSPSFACARRTVSTWFSSLLFGPMFYQLCCIMDPLGVAWLTKFSPAFSFHNQWIISWPKRPIAGVSTSLIRRKID